METKPAATTITVRFSQWLSSEALADWLFCDSAVWAWHWTLASVIVDGGTAQWSVHGAIESSGDDGEERRKGRGYNNWYSDTNTRLQGVDVGRRSE